MSKKALLSQQKLIEELNTLSADDDFKLLQRVLGGINYFKLCGMGRQETKHSYFLLNLFDPNGPHGWGSDFAKDFFENKLSLHLSPSFYQNLQTGRREYKFNKNESRIDLLLYSNDTVVLIENKVDAVLHDNQLYKYEEGINVDEQFRGHKVYYVFLTPDGRLPEDGRVNWETASYGKIIDSIIEMQKVHSATTQEEREMELFIKHYVKFLRNEVIKSVETLDEEVKKLYEKLYEKYPEAIAFLGIQRPDERLVHIYDEISKILMGEAQKRGLILKNGNGMAGAGRIQFKTKNMTENLLKKKSAAENPFFYEISAEKSNKMKAYAWAYNPDKNDNAANDLLAACGGFEERHGRKIIKSKCLNFSLNVDVPAMAEKLQTDNSMLIKLITDFLDEVQAAEVELKKFLDGKNPKN